MSNTGSGIGAAAGGAIGSIIPGIGTAIGSGIGGLLGGIFGGGDPKPPPPVAIPQAAPVMAPFNSQDAAQQQAAQQQAAHNTALTADQQQAFLQQLAAQNGAANQSAVFNQLQGVANGQGPNPAQAMLANQTGNNVAQQAALMASQRGAGANVGLLGRQAAMQGAGIQQQAAGQAAALQANQQLGALGQLGGIAGQQVGQQQAALGQQGALNLGQQGALQSQQNSILNNIQNTNAINSQNTGQQIGATVAQAGQQVGAATPLAVGAQQFGQNILGGALGGVGASIQSGVGGNQSTSNNTPGALVASQGWGKTTASNPQSTQGDYSTLYQGGEVTTPRSGPQSILGKHQAGGFTHAHTFASGGNVERPEAKGEPVKALVSPGEKILSKADAQAVKAGAKDPMSAPTVPGQAKVAGNSLKNDTVPMTLEAGGCVIPRSILMGKNPEIEAAKFVREHMKKHGKK